MESGLSGYNLGRFFLKKWDPSSLLVSTYHVLNVVLRALHMSFNLIFVDEEICGSERLNNMPGKYLVCSGFIPFQWDAANTLYWLVRDSH